MLVTRSRPYAKGAFEYAVDTQQLTAWAQFLPILAAMINHPLVKQVWLNPQFDKHKVTTLLVTLAKPLPVGGDHFIRLLALRRRLNLVSTIAELFTQYYLHEQKILIVNVVTAAELTTLQSNQLSVLLQQHFKQTITLKNQLDPHLLGGALVRINDTVIDVSLQGKLTRLAKKLVRGYVLPRHQLS
jgi:F-type H+-transporting ATPase subunit delta